MTIATQLSLGEIKLAGDLAGSNDGTAPQLTPTGITAGSYILPTVTFDAKGRAIAVSSGTSGTIAALIPDATATTKGVAAFPISGSLTVSGGNVSIVDATSSIKGIASFSTDFTVSAGAVSLNLANLPTASSTVFGVVKTGTNITNTAGVISVPDATSSVKGIASFSPDFTVTSGAVTLNTSTVSTTVLGLMPDATSSVKGIASFSPDFTVTSGAVSLAASVVRTDIQNTWSKAQSYTIVPLTFASTITPDFSLSNVFSLTATGNFTFANPTNVVAGTTYMVFVTQDATGGRTITWGSNFKFGGVSQNTLSTGASKCDIISITAVSSTVLLVTMQSGF